MRPIVCMITDRRRLPASRAADPADALVERVAVAARAGVHLVQVRERDLEGGALANLVARCVDAVRSTPARIIVNDRLDVAMAAGAHGVHLRSDSMPAPRVGRAIPRGFLVGKSVHSTEEVAAAAAAGGLDYLLFGTVFPTASKPGAESAGPRLPDAVAAASLPILAVGGVTAATARQVGQSGAAGFAAIGLFADVPIEALPAAVERAAAAFDTPRGLP